MKASVLQDDHLHVCTCVCLRQRAATKLARPWIGPTLNSVWYTVYVCWMCLIQANSYSSHPSKDSECYADALSRAGLSSSTRGMRKQLCLPLSLRLEADVVQKRPAKTRHNMVAAQLALWEKPFQTRTRKGHGYHHLLTIMLQRKWAWVSNFDISNSNGGDIGVVMWVKVCLSVIQGKSLLEFTN